MHKNCVKRWCIHPVGDFEGCPDVVRWLTYHTRCDPQRNEANVYRIDVERCRTVWALLDWTAHLISKRWFIHTNWNEFLRSAHTQIPFAGQPITRRPRVAR
ncbi:hypothetical protein I546_1145 [Mycobacterium kansasii 732]|nr:hypothetical protein I546_1145 [Mycobacterium kansasii 732]